VPVHSRSKTPETEFFGRIFHPFSFHTPLIAAVSESCALHLYPAYNVILLRNIVSLPFIVTSFFFLLLRPFLDPRFPSAPRRFTTERIPFLLWALFILALYFSFHVLCSKNGISEFSNHTLDNTEYFIPFEDKPFRCVLPFTNISSMLFYCYTFQLNAPEIVVFVLLYVVEYSYIFPCTDHLYILLHFTNRNVNII
jgi:hypothetical protein